MTLSLLLILLQSTPAAPPQPQRWSILTPTQDDCEKRQTDRGEIVVCAQTPGGQRLPPIDGADPAATPRGVNPNLTGAGALASEGTPCAAVQQGCTVGFGPPIVPIVNAAVGAVKSVFAKKPDKRGRISIPLD